MSGANGLPDDTFDWNALDYGSFPNQPLLFPTGTKTLTTAVINPEGRIIQLSSGSGPSGLALLIPVVTSASPYSVPVSQNTAIYASASLGADFTANLPPATGSGFIYILKKMDANAHNVIFDADGADLIDGLGTYTLTTQYAAVWVQDIASLTWAVLGVYVNAT